MRSGWPKKLVRFNEESTLHLIFSFHDNIKSCEDLWFHFFKDLDVKEMIHNHNLAKYVADVAWINL
jgi:hypothetical protein